MQEHHLASLIKEALVCRLDSHWLEMGRVLPKYRTGTSEDGGALPCVCPQILLVLSYLLTTCLLLETSWHTHWRAGTHRITDVLPMYVHITNIQKSSSALKYLAKPHCNLVRYYQPHLTGCWMRHESSSDLTNVDLLLQQTWVQSCHSTASFCASGAEKTETVVWAFCRWAFLVARWCHGSWETE